MISRTLGAAAALAVATTAASIAHADVTTSVDIGPVGVLGGVAGPSEQDFYRPPAVAVDGATLGRVEVWFNGRGLRVGGVDNSIQIVPGFAFGILTDFGLAPGDVNWVSDVTVGLLDKDAQVIASQLTDDEVIGAGGSILDEVAVPFDAVVYGFAMEFENPQVGPLPAGASVTIDFLGDLEIIAADPIDTVGVLSEESASYDVQSKRGGSGATSVAIVSAASPLGSFTHSFSALGETEWNIVWRAPAGQAFEIEVPSGFDGANVLFDFAAGGLFSPFGFDAFDGDVQTTVELLPGSDPLPLSSLGASLTGPGGNGANAGTRIEPASAGAIHRFASLTLTVTVPSDYDVDLDSMVSAFEIEGRAFTTSVNPAPPDPGQWVRLVPVPGCAGDVDGDGDTDVFDFADLSANFGAAPGATREQGDLTGDGVVDVFDFSELAADFGCATP
jgi:hypothetical protein